VEIEARSVTRRSRRLAIALAVGLVCFAAFAYVSAALIDFSLSGSESLDPHRRGYAVAGAFAAAFCLVALWQLREVARGHTGWGIAGLYFAFAVLALFVLLAVAIGSQLGG
jgi:hypothetical protein